ncbi:hypothetical protein ACAF76_005160 [Brevibacillus sp. TJ4]|uniref:hypothetical protein n=1 Tax=Brevibacillus sp. TJ4 TaxID=3234853 RepID=UPI0037CF71FE
MNNDFIRLKQLEGELKLTQMNKDLGCSVTSKELVFFKPHMTYHLFLHDIISVVPATRESFPVAYLHRGQEARPFFSADSYKLVAKWVRIVSRSGIVERENMEFIVPLSDKMLSYISQYSGLMVIR